MKIKLLIISLRPAQWIKNLIVFAGLVFSQNLFNLSFFIKSLLAFILFCLISGSSYIINDIIDVEDDKKHPYKSKRPLASGQIDFSLALSSTVLISTISFIASFLLNTNFGLIVISYFSLMIIYSFFLKRIFIIDILVISAGFVLRAIAGCVVIGVEISSWLFICALFLALLVVLGKRKCELAFFNLIQRSRPFPEYNPYILDQMIAIVTTSIILCYSLYALAEETIIRFKTKNLRFTIPFVLYGVFRYLYLIHKKDTKISPEEIILNDKPLLFSIFLWILSIVVIIYY